jgi:Domain of unknown function (DUF4355)
MAEYFTKDGDAYKPVDENLLTQTDVDKVVESRLERQKKQFADYDDLKDKASKVDTISKDFEDKLKAKNTSIESLTKELGGAKLETEKVKIVSEFKLSDELAEFVTGDTADDMRKRAEKLAKGVTGGTVVIDKKPKPEDKKSDTKKVAASLFGRKSDD